MLKLTIDNSTCKLEGLTPMQFKKLKEAMSYSINPSAAYFSGSYRVTRSLITPRGEFPTGLLYVLDEFLNGKPIDVQVDNKRIRPVSKSLGLISKFEYEPYQEQREASIMAQVYSRGIIVAPTGVGKSYIAALIIERLQIPTLVVVPSLELKRQLTATLTSIFGSMAHIRVENVDALDPNEVITEGCVIIDEFHRSGAKTYRKLNKKAWKNVYYKFGLTATPFRSQDNERLLLESVLSKVIYRVSHKTAVENGYIVPVEAYYVDLPVKPVKGHTWAQVYNELVVNNKDRNEIISQLLLQLSSTNTSALCLVKEIKHGEILNSLTGVPFANGLEELTRQYILEFNLKQKTCLIGTTGILGEGIDTKPCEYVIIAGLGRSKNAFMQKCGRSFRTYSGKDTAKIIIFRDASHKFTLNHFKAQVRVLKEEYGIKPARLEI